MKNLMDLPKSSLAINESADPGRSAGAAFDGVLTEFATASISFSKDLSGAADSLSWAQEDALIDYILETTPFDGSAEANGRYDITINYSGDSTYSGIFAQAAARWAQVITGDLPDSSYNGSFVDDLLIDASIVYIDGSGGILGQAGPDWVRSSSYLPVHGIMQFDSADVAGMYSGGTLDEVILHEMGHVLGIGTIWTALGLRTGNSSYYGFTGTNALNEYRTMSGNMSATSVPVEPGTMSGTSGSHWTESVFNNELMTGWVEAAGTSMPLSRLTVASLQDVGYTVNMSAADPYTMPGGTPTPSDDYPANTTTTAVVAPGAPHTGSLEVAGDHDWFRVQLSAGTTYTIQLQGAGHGAGTLSDPYLRLYNSSSTLVGQDDDSGGNQDSLLSYTPSTSGAYYIDAGAYGNAGAGTYTASVMATGHFTAPTLELAAFATGTGWSSNATYPRELADVNGDGQADIVGFGADRVYVSLATGSGHFAAPTSEVAAFAAGGGWSSDTAYPRELADVNGDGQADIVGFGLNGVYVSLATGGGHFAAPTFELAAFGTSSGWSSDTAYPRELADVNGDGRADIVGFGHDGVQVSLATGGGHFAAPTFELAAFGAGSGWTSDTTYPREAADVNGDGRADIVGFGADRVYVSLATGDGHFAAPTSEVVAFAAGGGWTSDATYPRELADVNGDGRADIVGFGLDSVYVSLATGSGHFAAPTSELGAFVAGSGWTSDTTYPREVADITGDQRADIVGFGYAGVYSSLSNFLLT